jgi:hypothetical protein
MQILDDIESITKLHRKSKASSYARGAIQTSEMDPSEESSQRVDNRGSQGHHQQGKADDHKASFSAHSTATPYQTGDNQH